MDNKQILNREDSENESVLYNEEELLDFFFGYFLIYDMPAIISELNTAKDAHGLNFIQKNYTPEKKVRDVRLTYEQGITKVWQLYADSQEEASEIVNRPPLRRAEEFITNRYPSFYSYFLGYLEPLVLVGMRGGWLIGTWWRAVNYGFSVTPTTEDEEEKPNAFPYLNVEDMTEGDRRAFRWTVEDVFFNIIGLSLSFYAKARTEDLKEKEYTAFETGTPLPPYPAEGLTKEELIKRHSTDSDTLTEKELFQSWLYEVELYLPIAVHRLDEALYYATKYSGAEYKEYIKSLNVEEDFNFNRGAGEYKKVMTEGYVWHWGE